MIDDFIAVLRSQHGTTASPVTGAEFRRVNQLLLERFFANVKRETGNWVRDGFRWHAYSFNHEMAISGDICQICRRSQCTVARGIRRRATYWQYLWVARH